MKTKRSKIRIRASRMKMYAYQKESGARVHCSDVPSAEGLEISGRDVGRRVRKRRPRSDPRNFYFYFLSSNGSTVLADHRSSTITPTHLALIDLIREIALVRCSAYSQYGGGFVEDFRARFNRVDLEKTYEHDRLQGRDRRRPDMTCDVDDWSIFGIAPTRMLVEVGVTSIVRDYSRYADLSKLCMPCIELLPSRLAALEQGKPGELDRILRKMLLTGAIQARWIVDPRLRAATVKSLSEVRAELDGRRKTACETVDGAAVTLRQLEQDRTAVSVPTEQTDMIESLRKVDAQLDSIMLRVNATRKLLRENTSLLRKVVEFVIPTFRDIRYSNIDEQVGQLLADLRRDPDMKRSGIIGEMKRTISERNRILRKADEAAINLAMAQSVASRIEAHSKAELEVVDRALQRVRFLQQQGQRNILQLPCQEIEDAVATEYFRHKDNEPLSLFCSTSTRKSPI